MTVFARIDHAQGAADAGLSLCPTELLVFGNARAGTPLMQARQTVGIDLPLRVLAWQSADRVVWLMYNDPGWIARRHGLGPALDQAVSRIAAVLGEVTRQAAAADE